MIKDLLNKLSNLWKKHICAPFPHPDQCYECNRDNCNGCNVNK